MISNKRVKMPPKGNISFNNIIQNKIQMILKNNIFNKSCMFKKCESLETLSVFSSDELMTLQNKEDHRNKENFESFIEEKGESFKNFSDDIEGNFYNSPKKELSDFTEITNKGDNYLHN